ncbi:MAG: 3-isopropylmalate dehydratase small subunit [Anaerolineales bacterium]|nr:3-isopropylmalate dehydratase small subunit [Anaerolineales bacterium]
MQALSKLHSCLIPLPYSNVDTDQIIPARFLKVTDKSGLADGLFSSWRYTLEGKPDPHFPLNRENARGCSILVAGDNFGSGSSREHAPWALLGWGIRSVISTSIADIFRSNSLKNGLLPIVVDADFHARLFDLANAWFNVSADQINGGDKLSKYGVVISVAEQTITLPDGTVTCFDLDAFSKSCFLQGVDVLGYLLKHQNEISAYEENIRASTKES